LSDLVNENTHIEAGDNRSATAQALYQLAALGVTIGIAVIGGSLTGKTKKKKYSSTFI
jgi:hypothetical protein